MLQESVKNYKLFRYFSKSNFKESYHIFRIQQSHLQCHKSGHCHGHHSKERVHLSRPKIITVKVIISEQLIFFMSYMTCASLGAAHRSVSCTNNSASGTDILQLSSAILHIHIDHIEVIINSACPSFTPTSSQGIMNVTGRDWVQADFFRDWFGNC